MSIKNKSLISITDFTKSEYFEILDAAARFEKYQNHQVLNENVIASLFFEPSTRTRLSFESAINRLGGRIVGFTDTSSTSVKKGESLNDTIRTVSNYCDAIVMRHPLDGSARFASEIASVPIINAGDGSNQHPTQTLLDLYSIRKTQGTLEDLNVCFVGDLKYGRTIHSLTQALSDFNCNFCFASPETLKIPENIRHFLKNKNISFTEQKSFIDLIPEIDVLYVTRVQKERFSDPIEFERVKNSYILKNNMLEKSKPNLKILHPLPRVNEIDQDVDSNEKAYYFEQALNGVYTRMAILSLILDKPIP